MKKIIFFISLITFLVITNSCSNENVKSEPVPVANDMYNKAYYENASLEQKVKYTEFHLLKIARFIAKDLKSKKITNAIVAKGRKDGNNSTILAEDLIKTLNLNNSMSKNNKEFVEIQKSLDAFKELEGESWLPTISTVVVGQNAPSLNKTIDDSEPIFVLSTDTEKENTIVDGYQLNDVDVMEKLDVPVDAQTATNNVVLKVGVQEAVSYINENGEVISGGNGHNSGGGGGPVDDTNPIPGGFGPTSPNYTYGLKIHNMTCLLKKESVFETNDVRFIGAKDNLDPLSDPNDVPQFFPSLTVGWNWNATVSGSAQTDYKGTLIRHFTSSEVDNQTNILLNQVIDAGSNVSNGQVLYYVIFEHDNIPAPKKTCTFVFPNGQIKEITYRSYENEYCKPMLFNEYTYGMTNITPFPSTSGFTCSTDNWMIHDLRRE